MSSRCPYHYTRPLLSGKPPAKPKSKYSSDIGVVAVVSPKSREIPARVRRRGMDPSLLSPPLSVNDDERPPFKPVASDQTSLTMKDRRGRRVRRLRGRPCDRSLASAEHTEDRSSDQQLRPRLASTSVPDLRHETSSHEPLSEAGQMLMRQELQALHTAYRKASIHRAITSERRSSGPRGSRRWTMPSKSVPTRVLSALPASTVTTSITTGREPRRESPARPWQPDPSRPLAPLSSGGMNAQSEATSARETPAMITLRRATNRGGPPSAVPRRASLRPNAIISFPAPKFNRTTSAYFSSLFGLDLKHARHENDKTCRTLVRQSSWNTGRDQIRSLRKASVSVDRVQLIANTVAAPAFTQVEVVPLLKSNVKEPEGPTFSVKQCSTTIVSGSSVHEIIWDENLTPSSQGTSSVDVSRHGSINPDHGRRQSVLVGKLEAQLRSDEQQHLVTERKISTCRRLAANAQDQRPSILHRLGFWDHVTSAENSGQKSSALDLKPDRDEDWTGNVTGHLAILPSAGPAPPPLEKIQFFPPLQGSASNSPRFSFASDQSWSPRGKGKRVMAEEPSTLELTTSSWSSSASSSSSLSHPISRDQGHAPQRFLRQIPLPQPSLTDSQHAMTGMALGQSMRIRRKSTMDPKKPSQQSSGGGIFSRKTSWAGLEGQQPPGKYDECMPLLQDDSGQRASDESYARRCGSLDGPGRAWPFAPIRHGHTGDVEAEEAISSRRVGGRGRGRGRGNRYGHHGQHGDHDHGHDDDDDDRDRDHDHDDDSAVAMAFSAVGLGLVRRDSPLPFQHEWRSRLGDGQARSGRTKSNSRGRGRVLSQVGEEDGVSIEKPREVESPVFL